MKKRIAISTLVTALILPAAAMARQNTNVIKTVHRKLVAQGKLFTVKLPSNPSTGYTWILRTLPYPISLVSSIYRQSSSCKPGMTGCTGEQIYTFRAEKSGQGTIELYYGRPWEPEQHVYKKQTELVVITKPGK
ncbi:protease inhibitor I42 family protein [Klebsiella pneumoniae]|nr:protease inhibitor I42 family protein [Klebsiella pneumoniae]